MPPPPKTPRPTCNPVDALTLFAKNLAEIERYHRRQPTGHELGQHVMTSLIVSDVRTALALAIEGKSWDPPA
mgnify:CR=1 FL=1